MLAEISMWDCLQHSNKENKPPHSIRQDDQIPIKDTWEEACPKASDFQASPCPMCALAFVCLQISIAKSRSCLDVPFLDVPLIMSAVQTCNDLQRGSCRGLPWKVEWSHLCYLNCFLPCLSLPAICLLPPTPIPSLFIQFCRKVWALDDHKTGISIRPDLSEFLA